MLSFEEAGGGYFGGRIYDVTISIDCTSLDQFESDWAEALSENSEWRDRRVGQTSAVTFLIRSESTAGSMAGSMGAFKAFIGETIANESIAP
jgi:hypothetical protein